MQPELQGTPLWLRHHHLETIFVFLLIYEYPVQRFNGVSRIDDFSNVSRKIEYCYQVGPVCMLGFTDL